LKHIIVFSIQGRYVLIEMLKESASKISHDLGYQKKTLENPFEIAIRVNKTESSHGSWLHR
jgi:hypothetical protein